MEQTSSIKAIETRYAGCRFRSRLEAKWAVFFDEIELEWKYEPEGFEVEYEDAPPLRYLPDFYLPKSETWVEVKGSDDLLKADARRLESILDSSSPLPGVHESAMKTGRFCRGLLILGDVPYIPPPQWGPVFHPLIQHHEGLHWQWARFTSYWPGVVCEGQGYGDSLLNFIIDKSEPDEWTTGAATSNTGLADRKVMEAYSAARMTRFEHGETPTSRHDTL